MRTPDVTALDCSSAKIFGSNSVQGSGYRCLSELYLSSAMVDDMRWSDCPRSPTVFFDRHLEAEEAKTPPVIPRRL